MENKLNLNIPLMLISNYVGYSLCAISLLPVSKETLKYGTDNAGDTYKLGKDENNNDFKNILETIVEKLKLDEHPVLEKNSNTLKLIKMASDVEIHKNEEDGKFYALDFARLIPPNHPSFPYSFLFRYEYIKNYCDQKISGDCFSGFGSVNYEKYDQICLDQIKKMKLYIKENFIPNLFEVSTFLIQRNLSIFFHSNGVNLRYLGYILKIIQFQNSCVIDVIESKKFWQMKLF